MRSVRELFIGVLSVFAVLLVLSGLSAPQDIPRPKVSAQQVYAPKTVAKLSQDIEPLSDQVFGFAREWVDSVKYVVRTEKCAPYFAMIRSSRAVAPLLFEAQMIVESLCDPNAVGDAGEKGLMQILPATHQWVCPSCNSDDLFDPRINLAMADKFYQKLFAKCRECGLEQSIFRYNKGQNAYVDGLLARGSDYVRRVDFVRQTLLAYNASS